MGSTEVDGVELHMTIRLPNVEFKNWNHMLEAARTWVASSEARPCAVGLPELLAAVAAWRVACRHQHQYKYHWITAPQPSLPQQVVLKSIAHIYAAPTFRACLMGLMTQLCSWARYVKQRICPDHIAATATSWLHLCQAKLKLQACLMHEKAC